MAKNHSPSPEQKALQELQEKVRKNADSLEKAVKARAKKNPPPLKITDIKTTDK